MTDQDKGPDQGAAVSLASLPREIAPPRDLWPAIERAIGQPAGDADGPWAGMPRDVQPPDDLWPKIAAGIEPARETRDYVSIARWRALPRLAAGVAIVAITGALLLRLDLFSGAVDPGSAVAFDPRGGAAVGPAGDPTATGTFDAWLASGLFGPEPAEGAPMAASFRDARQLYAEQIGIVRGQRGVIEASLQAYPDDPELLELWMEVYEAELLLIDEATRVLTGIQTGWYS